MDFLLVLITIAKKSMFLFYNYKKYYDITFFVTFLNKKIIS